MGFFKSFVVSFVVVVVAIPLKNLFSTPWDDVSFLSLPNLLWKLWVEGNYISHVAILPSLLLLLLLFFNFLGVGLEAVTLIGPSNKKNY
jgi:hypothetical protein